MSLRNPLADTAVASACWAIVCTQVIPLDVDRFGLTSRPLALDDAATVTELVRAYEVAFVGRALIELEDIVSDWQSPSFDLAGHGVGVFDGSGLVACAEVAKQRAEAFVHPDHQGRGLGAALVEWTEQVARRDHEDAALPDRLVGQSVPAADERAMRLLRGRGYRWRYSSWVLQLPADAQVPTPTLPAGVQIRQMRAGVEDRAVWQVVEDAFGEWPDRAPTQFEDWVAHVLSRSGFAPWQLPVAADDSEVLGACFVTVSDGAGWVHQVAVRRDRRGEGLGQALLAAAADASRAHGGGVLELNTDTRTGALGLYEHLGMVVKHTFEHWALPA